jgi:predicted metalloprotease
LARTQRQQQHRGSPRQRQPGRTRRRHRRHRHGGGSGHRLFPWHRRDTFVERRHGQPCAKRGGAEITQADEEAAQFVSVNLAFTEQIWAKILREQANQTYNPAVLYLFKGAAQSPCGDASGATGPFYCPGDQKVYLDTDFFNTMQQQLGASGDFAMAYVVAHEVAHHVQDELGILEKANTLRARVGEAESNAISVQIELQADCLSGIWARGVQEQFGAIQPGDFEEAFNAAKAIGDDTLQRNAGRRVSPESFTHGTSKQRSSWFAKGLKSGQLRDCNTFSAAQL